MARPRRYPIKCEREHYWQSTGEFVRTANWVLEQIAKRRNGTAFQRKWSSINQINWCPRCVQEMMELTNE